MVFEMSNYINSTSGQGTGLFFFIITIFAVGLRFTARSLQKTRRGWDDWLCIPAMGLICAMSIMLFQAAREDLLVAPKVPTNVSPFLMPKIMAAIGKRMERTLDIMFTYHILQLIALGLVKTSVLLFYRRIFCTGQHNLFHWASIAMITLMGIWTIGFLVPLAMRCSVPANGMPFNLMQGSPTSSPIKCDKIMPLQQSFAVSDLIMDAIILFFPIPSIWSLKMTSSRKAGITGIFLLGGLSVGASAARVAFFAETFKSSFGNNPIFGMMHFGDSLFWGLVECGMGLFAACLPTFQFIFTKAVRSRFSVSASSWWSRSKLSSQGSSKPEYRSAAPNAVHRAWRAAEGPTRYDSTQASKGPYPTAVRMSSDSIINAGRPANPIRLKHIPISIHKPLPPPPFVYSPMQNTSSSDEIDTIAIAKYGGRFNSSSSDVERGFEKGYI